MLTPRFGLNRLPATWLRPLFAEMNDCIRGDESLLSSIFVCFVSGEKNVVVAAATPRNSRDSQYARIIDAEHSEGHSLVQHLGSGRPPIEALLVPQHHRTAPRTVPIFLVPVEHAELQGGRLLNNRSTRKRTKGEGNSEKNKRRRQKARKKERDGAKTAVMYPYFSVLLRHTLVAAVAWDASVDRTYTHTGLLCAGGWCMHFLLFSSSRSW
jgi:hypothetical protein